MVGIARRLVRSIRTEGLLGALQRARYHGYEWFRETTLGISTGSRHDPYGPVGDEQRRPYEPLCYACIDAAFRRITPDDRAVFLDYGCGRGRIVAVAATHPFGKVIGVELNAELCAAARLNLQRLRGRRCQLWEVVESDATEFAVPEEVTVVFLFNPFLGEILEHVVNRVEQSLTSKPRLLSLFYVNPDSDVDVFESCRWLNLRAELPVGLWQGMRFRHYQSVVQVPH